jgi:hypothetical protein
MQRKLKRLRPSPAMIVALVALVAALGGTAYAAGQINGNSIMGQSIGGGKLKKQTLTGYQINVNKLGTVPSAHRALDTLWAVVHNPKGPNNATLTRASDPTISVAESANAVNVIFPGNVSVCANVAGVSGGGTTAPNASFLQTNISPANPNAIEVHSHNSKGDKEDSDFQIIVTCP